MITQTSSDHASVGLVSDVSSEQNQPNMEHTEGGRIARRRVALGWTQQELAERARVAKSTLIQLEKGRNVSLHTFHNVTLALEAGEVERGPRGNEPSPRVAASSEAPQTGDAPDSVAAAILAMVRRVDTGVQERMLKAVAAIYAESRGDRKVAER